MQGKCNHILMRIFYCSRTRGIIHLIPHSNKSRDEFEEQFGKGMGPLILARTDSLAINGFEEAVQRMLAFREVGCDMTFLEAPQTVEQMQEYCRVVSGPKLANMLEYGSTPILRPEELKTMGYTMAGVYKDYYLCDI